MSSPITWRNVSGPALTDAGSVMARAAATLDGAFSKWGSTIDDYQKQQKEIFDKAELGRVMDFRERLARAKTPEEVAALQTQLDALRGGLTAASREKILGAEEARIGSLQDQFIKNLTYKNTVTDDQQHPLVQELRSRIAADPTRATQIMAEPQYAVLRNIGTLAGEARAAETAAEKLGFDRNQDKRSQTQLDENLRHNEVSEKISQQNADTQARSVKLQGELQALQKAGMLDEKAAAATSAALAANSTLAGSDGATKTLHDSLKAAGVTGSKLEYMVEYGNRELANPLNKGVPVSIIVNTLLSTDKWNVPGFNWAKGGPGADVARKIQEWRDSAPGKLAIATSADNAAGLAARAASARELAARGFQLAGMPELTMPAPTTTAAPAPTPAAENKPATANLKAQQAKDVKTLDDALARAQNNSPKDIPPLAEAQSDHLKALARLRTFGSVQKQKDPSGYKEAVQKEIETRMLMEQAERKQQADLVEQGLGAAFYPRR